MTPEVRRRCLDPYFSTKGSKGTGLGLSMVFGIIKRHDGVLEIDSTPGKGTTFRVRLPVHADQAHWRRSEAEAAPARHPQPLARPSSSMTIPTEPRKSSPTSSKPMATR